MSDQTFSLIPASYLLLRKGEEVLLSRRFQTGYEDGKWSVPAGHVEKGETFTDCLVREIGEEIGLSIDPGVVRFSHCMQRFSMTGQNRNRMDMFFVVDKWEGEPRIMEPEKCDGLEWFSIKSLPENTIPYIRRAIELAEQRVPYSEFGF